ncbi:hypothetical protein E1I21_06310 [Microbacterium oleivorans]|uniref:hypothetical protein n=1 Tax=Microbacterium oleivorans TaxID=273677 RepID=UPI0010A2F47A|nr:hypothetical protein [Microbacterium oleivorans]THE07708.1 hypothetical protein E1I21_06310 [Microbacterium oleivorans]
MSLRSLAATALVGTCLLLSLTACAPADAPAFTDVRTQTEDAVTEIVAALPKGSTYTPAGDATSTPCSSGTGGVTGPRGTSFATVQGEAILPDMADAASVIADLPTALGEGWAVEPVGIDVALATARLNRAGSGVSVDVTERAGTGAAALEILAVSRCGRVD